MSHQGLFDANPYILPKQCNVTRLNYCTAKPIFNQIQKTQECRKQGGRYKNPSGSIFRHQKNAPAMVWTVLPFGEKHMISPGLSSVYRLSLSLFSCYETLRLKPRLPRFITGGTKAKALDKAGQTNSNQLPLNTHITPPSAPLTHK